MNRILEEYYARVNIISFLMKQKIERLDRKGHLFVCVRSERGVFCNFVLVHFVLPSQGFEAKTF